MAKSAKRTPVNPAPRPPPRPRAAGRGATPRALPRATLVFAAAGLAGAALAAYVAHRDAGQAPQEARAVALASAPLPPARPAPEPSPAAPPSAPVALADLAPPPPAPAAPSRMSATVEAAFDAWLMDAYRQCWTPPRPPSGDADPYLPKVRIALKADGALAASPKLVNPPSDPSARPQADAALKAVKSCDPLRVPDKYAPYYAQWKTKTVYFSP